MQSPCLKLASSANRTSPRHCMSAADRFDNTQKAICIGTGLRQYTCISSFAWIVGVRYPLCEEISTTIVRYDLHDYQLDSCTDRMQPPSVHTHTVPVAGLPFFHCRSGRSSASQDSDQDPYRLSQAGRSGQQAGALYLKINNDVINK